MPSALFEIYQKNFDKTLKRLSGMIELYQNQTKEAQAITLKEIELNISEMERSISQMELELILEKIPDNKKKLTKIIENNKNIVKQYKREIQDLKYKDQSILNKKNLAYIPTNKKKKTTQLNFLKDENNVDIDISNQMEDEDTALFIDKNNYKKNNSEKYDKYIINDINEEVNYQKDEAIKRINEHHIDNNNDIISNINNGIDIDLSSKKKKNEDKIKDKDLENNKYKINKDNIFKKIMRIIFNILQFLLAMIIAFYKNILYKGYVKLKHYLNHRYGQANTRVITMVLFIIVFVVIYSLILILCNSYKSSHNNIPINLIEKNNSEIFESKNETINNTNKIDNISARYTNYTNSNNQTSNISSNYTNNINYTNSNNQTSNISSNYTNNINYTNSNNQSSNISSNFTNIINYTNNKEERSNISSNLTT